MSATAKTVNGMAQAQAADARVVVSRTQRMMATEVSVQIAAEPSRAAEAEAALAACFAWFAEVEQRLTRFDPASELCALNRSAGGWFDASATLYTAVYVAVRAAFASEGVFNPALLQRIEALGYDRDFALIAHTEAPRDASRVVEAEPGAPLNAWKEIIFDSAQQRIRLPEGVALDLGGIAKGWAADVALERYCLAFPGALLNVGGDLRLHGGPQPGQAWRVGLRDPLDPAEASVAPAERADAEAGEVWNRATLTFSRGALATSGAVRRWWRRDGVTRHHLLDGRTGQPLPLWTSADAAESRAMSDAERLAQALRGPQVATVTALAPTGAQAEVATKLALARGLDAALAAVEGAWARWGAVGPEGDCDASVALIFTLSDGRISMSRNLDEWLATWGTEGASLPMLLSAPGAQPLALDAPPPKRGGASG